MLPWLTRSSLAGIIKSMNDINNTSIQRSIDKVAQEERIIAGSWNLLNASIKKKEKEIYKLEELLDNEEATLNAKSIVRNTLESYADRLLVDPLEGLPVSLDGGTTWCVVTSQGIDEHGNITVSDGKSTRSVAFQDIVPAPIIISRSHELRQAPVGTTIFLGLEVFEKVGDTAWLKRERKITYMDDGHANYNVDSTSEVSAWDMEELMQKMLLFMVSTWGDTSMGHWR